MNDHTASPADEGLDLDEVQDEFTAEVELRHPRTGLPTGAFITLAGPEHPDRKAKAISLQRAARAAWLNKANKPKDVEEDIAEGMDMLARATLGWSGMKRNQKPLPFSQAAARELYADPKAQWIVRQLMADMNNTALFIKA